MSNWNMWTNLFGADSLFGEDALGNLLAAAFGAFAGGLAGSRSQSKRAVIAELNAVAAARALSFFVANTFLGLKRQHVRHMRRQFIQNKREFLSARRAAARGAPIRFEARLDLQTLSAPKVPTELLERSIFEKLTVRGRPLVTVVALINAIEGLRTLINDRNACIEEWRVRESIPGGWAVPDVRKFELYFGVRNAAGGPVDERFLTFLRGIYKQTDDCIFFARMLELDLFEYAGALHRKNRWKYRLGLAAPYATDWSIAVDQNLMPSDSQYQAWLSGFKNMTSKQEDFFSRLRRVITW
jgi:hypothetical protein